jgi:hypothetical protein
MIGTSTAGHRADALDAADDHAAHHHARMMPQIHAGTPK